MSNNFKTPPPNNTEAQNVNANQAYNAPYPYSYLNPNMPPNPQMNYYWNNYQYQQFYQQQQQFNYYQQYSNQNYMQPASNVNNRPNEPQQSGFNSFNRNQNYQNKNNQNFHNKNNNRTFNNNSNQSKKPKIDKRDLPENNKYYCEVCDRGFKLEEKYNEHLATHTTCNVSGCKFTAAAKLVEIHYRNFHATGLDRKLNKLETQEEIEKYINERKRNFPSNSNQAKKSKFDDEKTSRGLALNTQQFGRLKSKNRKYDQNSKKSDENVAIEENAQAEGSINKENESAPKSQLNRVSRNKNFNKKRKNKKGGLLYRKTQLLKYQQRKPTLLQKLLADEIRHERNIILQCVRYVVKNNFFAISNDKAKNDTQ